MVNLYSIFCNTGKKWYDVIPSIADAKSCLMSSDLLDTNVVWHVENFPVKADIAEKPTNKKNGISKSLVYCALFNTANTYYSKLD